MKQEFNKEVATGLILIIIIGVIIFFGIRDNDIKNTINPGNITTNVTNNSNSKESDKNTNLDKSRILTKTNSIVGELDHIYRANTEYKNKDGSYIVLNFVDIKKHYEITSNTGKKINNAIVLRNVVPVEITRNFVKDVATFQGISETGKELTIGDIYTQTNGEYSEIIIEAIDDLKNYKYLVIGGFDDTRYDKKKMLFEIQ